MLKNKSLLIIAVVALVNSLGYGIIIPIQSSYTHTFGLNDFQNGLLFAIFSLCQFLATPLIGRFSDKYGRKPLLGLSLAGTALSFFMMAFAPNAVFLFMARALDGITAGNIPVAFAVIADTTEPKDRAKGFGIIGAAFGFGFIFGPAIAGLTVGIAQNLPFIIAGVIAIVSVILTVFVLPETNKHKGEISDQKLFDFRKLYQSLFDENLGKVFMITFLYALAFALLIVAYNPFVKDVLGFSDSAVSGSFMIFGLMGLIAQTLVIGRTTKKFGIKKTFISSIVVVGLSFFAMGLLNTLLPFIIVTVTLGLSNSLINPLLQTILSRETDEKSQGSMQGLNASYMSIGQIVGPLIGGALATSSIRYPFLLAGLLMGVCLLLSFRAVKPDGHKQSAF